MQPKTSHLFSARAAREYRETHDPEIPEQIFELARRLREMTIVK
jgi:hypothetical protein